MRPSKFAILVTAVAIGCGCRPETIFEQLMDARRLTAEIRVHFTKSADATNRAVMSGAEEAAVAFVREAQEATRGVQSNADLLRPMLSDLRYSKESQLLAEFETKFFRLTTLNSEILTLSRRNSNVHALALSLGQKRILVAACEETLLTLQGELANRGFPGTR